MLFLGLGLLQWTALATIAAFLVVVAAIAAILVNLHITQADRRRDDARRREDRQDDDERRAADRQWDSEQRKEEREYDAELRRQDREREDQLRRETDEKWERRRRAEQCQREDDDAQQHVVIEFPAGSAQSQAEQAARTPDRITHRIIVTTPAAYPIKQLDAQIAYQANSGLGMLPPGWTFGSPVTENGQMRYTCYAHVPDQTHDATPIVRFTAGNGALYYSYRGYTRRFGQNTEFINAAMQLDMWIRTGPEPDEPAT
jgi:hypothetical protein